jgi:HNH endonuclease
MMPLTIRNLFSGAAGRLRERLHYEPETGVFTRQVKGKRKAGTICNGYWAIRFEGRPCKASRLAWLYMTGEWPKEQIDHANDIKADDRWRNLREATQAQNTANGPIRVTNKCGFKYVTRVNRKWRARIVVSDKQIHLGYFPTPELAHAAYYAAAKQYFREFARAA